MKDTRNSKVKVKSTRNKSNALKINKKNKASSKKSNSKNTAVQNTKNSNIYSIEQVRRKYTSTTPKIRARITHEGEIKTKIQASNTKNKKSIKENTRKTAIYANIFSILIFVAIIVYFSIFFIKFFNKEKINYDYVQMGTIESPKSATGIIIRSEKVYNSTQDGILSFNITNNERVKSGTSVATIKSLEVLSKMEEELNTINKEIFSMQESRAELSWFSEDIEKINYQIQNIIDTNIYLLSNSDISKLYEISTSVSSSMELRNQILLSETTGSLAELAAKRKEQEDKISENSSIITTSQTGILSYYLDGLEEVFTPDNMLNITKEQVKMTANPQSIKLQVAKEEPIFKIIDSNEWYISTYINSSFVEGWEQGQNKTIYIKDSSSSREIDTQVYYIQKDTKETFMILKLTRSILDYIDQRSITFEIDKVTSGFKINNSAIAEANLLKIPINFITEEDSIIKQSGDSTTSLNVSLSYEPDILDFAYIPIEVGVINIGDTIVNPNNPEETYIIDEILTTKGVYVINSGIAKYVKINLQNSVSNDKYTILDPSFNTNITIYDNIILDVQNIYNEQSVYK